MSIHLVHKILMLYHKDKMRFILPIIAIIAITIGIAYYRFFISPQNLPKNEPKKNILTDLTNTETSSLDDGKRLKSLEEKVASLSASSGLKNAPQTETNKDELKVVETAIRDLQARVATLEQTGSENNQPAQTRSPVYIPLGSTGSSQALDWTSLATFEVEINSDDYTGYSNMYLEVNMRAFQGNGKAFARLSNKTDGTAVGSSEVSTTSSDYTTVTSAGFKLSGGKKTYRLQLKTLTGYAADVQFARIRVTF